MMLDIRDLRVSLPTERGLLNAVRGVDLQIARGQTLCLVGESGCGKSLTATSIMGLLTRQAQITTDRFEMAGQDLTRKPAAGLARMRGRDVAMIFQDPTSALNPTLTVGRQLTEGVMRSEKLSRRAAEARAVEMLERVGISNPAARLAQYPHGFSGGQRQRIMIASALMGRPKLLIADEPTTALDVTIQAQILQLLGELQADLGLSILLITHDLGVVAAIADDVAVMYAGRIVEEGRTAEILDAPRHPYTARLMACVPELGGGKRRLEAIAGLPPAVNKLPPGCAFAERCTRVQEDCRQGHIPLARASGHGVRCLHPIDDSREAAQ